MMRRLILSKLDNQTGRPCDCFSTVNLLHEAPFSLESAPLDDGLLLPLAAIVKDGAGRGCSGTGDAQEGHRDSGYPNVVCTIG